MEKFLKRTWAEIDIDAIDHNFFEIKNHIKKDCKVMCVIKADAYGHGAVFLAREYQDLGADWFAVSNLEEALQLRQGGIIKPILILGYTPYAEAPMMADLGISQAVLSLDYAKKLSKEAYQHGKKLNVHIKLDTGMSRIGINCQSKEHCNNSLSDIKEICRMDGLNVEGMFTHFAVADDGEAGKEFTLNQYNNFSYVRDSLSECGINIPLCHCSNSAALIDYDEMNFDMVRAGVILYGLNPSQNLHNSLDLKPAMSIKSVVSMLKTLEKGAKISYGGTFTTKGKTKVATVPIGYADGYIREFSNRASMIVRGKKVPVIGRVCMDQLMLDVTDVDGIQEGDIVTVLGKSENEEISADDLSKLANTINYEIVCLVGKRVPRLYYKGGKIVGQLNYIYNYSNN